LQFFLSKQLTQPQKIVVDFYQLSQSIDRKKTMNLKDRTEFDALRADINAALAAVAAKYALESISATKINVDGFAGNFTVKLEAVNAGGMTPDARMYEAVCKYTDGLPALGAEFKSGQSTYKILGASPTGRKIRAARPNGTVYEFTIEAVIRLAAA
jgi:hypothetical protein